MEKQGNPIDFINARHFPWVRITWYPMCDGPWCLHTMGVPRSSAFFIPAEAYLSMRMWAAPGVLMIVVAEGAFLSW